MRARIAHDLPQVPDEVIDRWLMPLTKRVAWPPAMNNDWRYILGGRRDLTYLQHLTWRQQRIKLSPSLFVPRDMGIVIDLFRTHVLKEHTIYSATMNDGAARFDDCKRYLAEHGDFPWPVVLEESTEGLHILDGYHRMCAFFYLYGYFSIERDEVPSLNVLEEQSVWVATHV